MKVQAKYIKIDSEVSLRKYYPYYSRTLTWYQDVNLCKQVDNINYPYSLNRLKAMYRYLSKNCECYYIVYKENNRMKLIGDVTLKYNGELAIVIEKNYQNKHVGRRVISTIISRAKDLDLQNVFAEIFDFNLQSIKMFESLGFKKAYGEKYIYNI